MQKLKLKWFREVDNQSVLTEASQSRPKAAEEEVGKAGDWSCKIRKHRTGATEKYHTSPLLSVGLF